MGESKNIIETLSKTKIVGWLLALIGLFLFFMPVAFLTQNMIENTAPLVTSTVLYVIADIAEIAVAIVLWVISAKILRAKSQ
ncbi:MAG: hypothetical protein IMZ61_01610 [Planctomycetes bacterium]|nr:hypothetical protein [Planctomycetota bacterium]